MDWTKVITDPLGLIGYIVGLMLVFAGKLLSQKRRSKDTQWIGPAAYALAVISVAGCLFLAYRHQSASEVAKNMAPHLS